MEAKEVYNQDMSVDLEKGNGMDINSVTGHTRTMREGSWDDLVSLKDDRSHHMSCCSSHCLDSVAKNGESLSSEGELKAERSDNSVGGKEKKKWFKKPPRPPRPPTTSPLDPSDQKLISELSELAVLKRARIERMKALKKMKNSKPASSIGNLVALIITVIFCLFILWQALLMNKAQVFSRHQGSIKFYGPSVSSIGTSSSRNAPRAPLQLERTLWIGAEAAKVESSLLRFMAADMGVEPERLQELFRGHPQTMRVTYYPPCRQASKVIRLSPHTDACALTLLLHVNDVQGLQIRSNDMILSNGRYKSVEHRAVVHPNRERIAAALFHQVHPSTTVGPLPELVERGGVLRHILVSHADFLKHFFSSKFDGRRSHLDHFRI